MTRWEQIKSGQFADAVTDVFADLDRMGFRPRFEPLERGSPPRAGEAILLNYAPVARMNKYQALLYAQGRELGFGVIPTLRFEDLDKAPWPGRRVIHFHWIASVTRGAADGTEASSRAAAFLRDLDRLKEQLGARLVWTAHNVLPHDSAFPEVDLELRRGFVERLDAVHLLSHSSRATLEDTFDRALPAPFVVEHPTYENAYADFTPRSAARFELGVSEDDFVVLCFGSIQKYKGYERLKAAFESFADRCPGVSPRLVIAGKPVDEALAASLRRWAATRSDVMIHARNVPDDEVHMFFRAADASVITHENVLNSGVALLALTFGNPLLAPDLGAFREIEEMGLLLYRAGDDDSLVDALCAATRPEFALRREATALARRRFHPHRISTAFFTGLMEALGWPVPHPRMDRELQTSCP